MKIHIKLIKRCYSFIIFNLEGDQMIKKILILSSSLLFIACGDGSSSNNSSNGSGDSKENTTLPTEVTTALSSEKSTLSQPLKDALTYMYSEEGLAHDVYLNINKIQPLQQFENIAKKSEVKHMEAVNQLAIKYDLNITRYPDTDKPYSTDDLKRYGDGKYPVEPVQELYNILYDKGITSKQNALEVGCMVEVVDVDDLLKYLGFAKASNASDVEEVFTFLVNGSYNHYWAFDKGLKDMGVSEGCCVVSDYAEHNFCHPEYPNEDDHGKKKGKK